TVTPTSTMTPTPLPESARIEGVEYQHQHGLWNYCGPANLAMAVSFWGWQTDRLEAGAYLRGGSERGDDKNVMPYEMQNFVHDQTGLRMIVRYGGDLELLKALIAAGFPVMVEKDDVIEGVGWLGHYLLLVGYDNAKRQFISMDTYHGEGTRYDYDFLVQSWRAFNFTFLVTYPPEVEESLFAVIGPWVDETWATERALEITGVETLTLTGRGQFFAWFNRGTSLVALDDYAGAASAFDTAFEAYAELSSSERPWRMVWYQTGPYWAYYYTGRYYDVIALADQTLDSMADPILEESFYWRGLAKEALGDVAGAIEDLQTSVELNANFGPGWAQLQRMQGDG
ncbi:MAG: C39 family peptidase, partial [Anaerolineales bacterium]